MFLIFGNLDLTTTTTLAPIINGDLLNIVTLFLLIGAMAKSAQIGLHIWLPNAMEGKITLGTTTSGIASAADFHIVVDAGPTGLEGTALLSLPKRLSKTSCFRSFIKRCAFVKS